MAYTPYEKHFTRWIGIMFKIDGSVFIRPCNVKNHSVLVDTPVRQTSRAEDPKVSIFMLINRKHIHILSNGKTECCSTTIVLRRHLFLYWQSKWCAFEIIVSSKRWKLSEMSFSKDVFSCLLFIKASNNCTSCTHMLCKTHSRPRDFSKDFRGIYAGKRAKSIRPSVPDSAGKNRLVEGTEGKRSVNCALPWKRTER